MVRVETGEDNDDETDESDEEPDFSELDRIQQSIRQGPALLGMTRILENPISLELQNEPLPIMDRSPPPYSEMSESSPSPSSTHPGKRRSEGVVRPRENHKNSPRKKGRVAKVK